MKGSVHDFRALMIPVAVGAIGLSGIGNGIPSAVQAEDKMKVEIAITDK